MNMIEKWYFFRAKNFNFEGEILGLFEGDHGGGGDNFVN